MQDFFQKPEVIWFLIGLGMFLLELAAPGLILLFFGIGAWATAICCMFLDVSINSQIFIFIATSLISLLLLRKTLRKKYPDSKKEGNDDMRNDYIGKSAQAITSFVPGQSGKVAFRGSIWEAVSSHTIAQGQHVIIVGFESIQLIVEPHT